MDALYKCMFIIIETIVNSMKTRHVSKVIDVFLKNLFMSIRHMKKNTRFPLLLFLCTEQCTYTNLFTFFHTGQLTSSEHAKCT